MTWFLSLYKMFQEVVVYTQKIVVVKIQKLLKTGCEYVWCNSFYLLLSCKCNDISKLICKIADHFMTVVCFVSVVCVRWLRMRL